MIPISDKIQIRLFRKEDDVEVLKSLLNSAYKPLADRGFRFLGSYQDVPKTIERIESGECYVAVLDNVIIGTILYRSPEKAQGNFWNEQPFVATFGQFAVDKDFQRAGVGGALIELAEQLARRDGAKELSLDTAEGAIDLIEYYTKRGYRFVGYCQWDITNYRSILLSKKIGHA